jgi:RNA polymerase sigma-70 factor (ECF subfamily)
MPMPAGDPLVEGLAAGREEAFAALYDRFGPGLYGAARLILRSGPDAEDAVQDVFVGLVRARKELHRVENLRAYVYAALRRSAVRIASARKGERPLLAGTEPTALEAPGLDAESSARLERALLALPDEQREVVALKFEGGLTFAEIAAALGIRPNTAASRYRYALEKLRAAFGK